MYNGLDKVSITDESLILPESHYIESKSVSRQHLIITVSRVKTGDGVNATPPFGWASMS